MSTIDPIWRDDTQQQVFRQVLDAFAFPGKCQTLNLTEDAQRAVLATLLDNTCHLFAQTALLNQADWRLLQAQPSSAAQADYLLCDAARAPDFTPRLGSLGNPEQSATVLLVAAQVGSGSQRWRLQGPGIPDVRTLSLEGVNPAWLQARADWCCAFPMGVDMLMMDQHRLVALPRTTQIEVLP